MRQSDKWCGRSEAAKVKRGGERCGQSEAADRAAGRREVRRTCGGAHRPPRGERGGAGKATVGNGARAPSPPPVRTSLPRRPSERPILAARPNVPSSPRFPLSPPPQLSFPLIHPPHFSAATPLPPLPLPPLPPRPYGRGGRGKSQTRRAAFGGAAAPARPLGARRLPWDGGLPLGGGLAQAAAGRAGRQKGTKCPFFPAFGQKYAAKYCNFRPRVLY